jgi:outer membrane autotransporter protein
MSGDQYNYLVHTARYGTERFKNSIYNAIRYTLTPCGCMDPCELIETWYQVEGGQYFAQGDDNCAKMHGTNWDMTLGAHIPICNELLLGLAVDYQNDHLIFDQGGKTTRQTGNIAGYLIGRSEVSYILAEVMYGASNGSYKRPIDFGTTHRIAKSSPKITQGLFYGELGMNYSCRTLCNFFAQPFIGLQYGHYDQNKIKEHGANSLDLNIKKINKITFDTLLGVHLFSAISCVDLSADIYWQHRYDSPTIKTKNHFADFGDNFHIKGCKFGQDGVHGNLAASYQVTDKISLYIDFTGEYWERWSTYGGDIGINARW